MEWVPSNLDSHTDLGFAASRSSRRAAPELGSERLDLDPEAIRRYEIAQKKVQEQFGDVDDRVSQSAAEQLDDDPQGNLSERRGYLQVVYPLVFRGFLTLRVVLLDHEIVLKTLTESEMISAQEPIAEVDWASVAGVTPEDSEPTNELEIVGDPGNIRVLIAARQLAYSTLYFNGSNMLDIRCDPVIRNLAQMYLKFPELVLKKLLTEVSLLSQWSTWALGHMYRFCLEPLSRSMWATYRTQPLNDDRLTGLPGTQKCGLTAHQRIFRRYNELLDERDVIDRSWDEARFIASASNPKGVRVASQKADSARKEREVRERRVLAGVDSDKIASFADMEEKLLGEIHGQKDDRDQFVREYILDRIREIVVFRLRRRILGDMLRSDARKMEEVESEYDSDTHENLDLDFEWDMSSGIGFEVPSFRDYMVFARSLVDELQSMNKAGIYASREWSDDEIGSVVVEAKSLAEADFEKKTQARSKEDV